VKTYDLDFTDEMIVKTWHLLLDELMTAKTHILSNHKLITDMWQVIVYCMKEISKQENRKNES
jgi:hypothetical protein